MAAWEQSDPEISSADITNQPHSGVGIASFILSILSGMAMLGVIALAGVLASRPEGMGENSAEAMLVGFGILGIGGLLVVSLVLGIATLYQEGRNKVFGIIGMVLSGLAIAGVVALIAIGMAMG